MGKLIAVNATEIEDIHAAKGGQSLELGKVPYEYVDGIPSW